MWRPWGSITVPPNGKRRSRRRALLEFLAAREWSVIGETEWRELQAAIPDLRSEDLRTARIPTEAPWRGVGQHTLDDLETSLVALASVYETRPDLRRFCRSEVIRAKDRARIISVAPSSREETRQLKREMVEWMLVWLGDPSLFSSWISIRSRHLSDKEINNRKANTSDIAQ